MTNHAGEALFFVATVGVFDAMHTHPVLLRVASQSTHHHTLSPYPIWVAAQNHGLIIAINRIEPLNFAAITSCPNVVQLQCCGAPR
jgi:hypothetical protein